MRTCSLRRRLAIASATVAAVVSAVLPAGATSITSATVTFDDTLVNDTVNVIWSGAPGSGATVSGTGCTGTLSGASGTANCSESGPITFNTDLLSTALGSDFGVNFWESQAGVGPVSDTLLGHETVVNADANLYHIQFVFQSDVDGGPLLVPLSGNNVLNWLEPNGPLRLTDENSLPGITNSVTVQSDISPVPEPASLTLLGSGLLAGAARWRKRNARP